MTGRESRGWEARARTRKAARLALEIALAITEPTGTRAEFAVAARDSGVRRVVQEKCGYGHVSNETWEEVEELLRGTK